MSDRETAELEAVDAALAGRAVASEHTELADLALLLRDDRPQPDPTWATELDRRAAAGFPARPRRRPRLQLRWLAPVAAAAAVILPLVVAIAVFDGSDDETQLLSGPAIESEDGAAGGMSDAAGGGGEQAAGASRDSAEDAGAGAGQSRGGSSASTESDAAIAEPLPPQRPGGDPDSDDRRGRRVERSAALTLAAPSSEIDRVAARAGRVAADVGGFVAESSVASTRGGAIQLRVPSARLDTAIQRLSRLGRVRELSRQTRDITSVVVSARERLNDARTERESLLRQLAAATTVNETESIRARLRIVSREIASARARLRTTTNRAQFADISVALTVHRGSAEEEADEGAWTPADAFDDALRMLEVAAGVALIAAAAALPLLIAAALGWGARRGLARRRRERALDLA